VSHRILTENLDAAELIFVIIDIVPSHFEKVTVCCKKVLRLSGLIRCVLWN